MISLQMKFYNNSVDLKIRHENVINKKNIQTAVNGFSLNYKTIYKFHELY